MMEELKPCPFCGGTKIEIIEEEQNGMYGCGIGCINPMCNSEPIIILSLSQEQAKEKAIEAWNRRAE